MPLRGTAAVWITMASVASAEAPESPEEVAAPEEVPALEVSVEGSPLAPSPLDPTPAAYVARGEALSDPGVELADVLDRSPGVQTVRSGGAADPALASLRGAGSAQTPVYLAGLRLNDELTGAADLSTVPPWFLHRVTTYRGHVPRWLDQRGMAGAIALEPRLPDGVRGSAAAGAGSFGTRRTRAALSVGDDRAGAVFSFGSRRGEGDFTFVDDGGTRFDGSDDRVRRRRNADYHESDGWALARWRAGPARVVALVHAFAREAGAPGLQLPGARRSRVAVRRSLGLVSARIDRPGYSLQAGAGLVDSRYHLRDPLRELAASRDVDTRSTRVTQRLRAAARPSEAVSLGLGATLERTALALDSNHLAEERAKRDDVRVAADGMLSPLAELDLVAVMALSCQTTSASAEAGRACGLLEPTGRLGARARPSSWSSLFANLGRYVRAPTLGEKYGVSAAVLGNPSLLPETGYSLEVGAGADGVVGAVAPYAQLVGFARLATDLVGYRRASLGAVRPYNVAEARVLGMEVVAGLRFARLLHLSLALTFLDPRDVTAGRTLEQDLLPHVARFVAVPAVVLKSPAWPRVGLLDARVEARFRHQASRAADPAGLVTLEAQNLMSLAVAAAFDSGVTLRGRIENLLDDHTFDFIGYPLPGRAFHGLVEVGF